MSGNQLDDATVNRILRDAGGPSQPQPPDDRPVQFTDSQIREMLKDADARWVRSQPDSRTGGR